MNVIDITIQLINAASDATGIPQSVIKSTLRHTEVVEARWACWLVMREAGMPLKTIGDEFNRDHATIIHGLKSAKAHRGIREASFRELCKTVKESIQPITTK